LKTDGSSGLEPARKREIQPWAPGRNGNYIPTVRRIPLAAEKEKFKGVTSSTLFRGFTREELIGPFVSQLLLKSFDYGGYFIDGTMAMYEPFADYLIDEASWLACQLDVAGLPNRQGPFCQTPSKISAAPVPAGISRFTSNQIQLAVRL